MLKLLRLQVFIIVAIGGQLWSPECMANDSRKHPWTLEYRLGGIEYAIVKETGEVTLRRSAIEGRPASHGRGTLDKSETKQLFDLAAQPGFLKSEKEYLPRPGTWKSYNYVMVSLQLKDASGNLIHQVTCCDAPEQPIPATVKELTDKVAANIHKKFGALPLIPIN